MKDGKSIIFADLQGLKVKESEALRVLCDKEKVFCMMAKKTLFALALKEGGYTEIDARGLNGEVALFVGNADEVAPARVLANFAKEHDKVKLLEGILTSAPAGSRHLDTAALKQFAALPSKQELLSSLVGTLANPIRGLMGVCNGPMRGFAQVLRSISEQKA